MRIAVIGGGISGLSAAFYLRRHTGKHSIVLYEKSKRLGGWIRSDKWSPSTDSEDLVFERGPRTLRPVGYSGAVTLKLIHDLGLENDIQHVAKDAPAALNRLILNMDRIERMPSSLFEFFWKTFESQMLKDLILPPQLLEDESVHDFMTRHFGRNFTETIFSALVHGIHATNTRNLSIRAGFPLLFDAARISGSILLGYKAAVRRRDTKLDSLLTNAGPIFSCAWKQTQKNTSLYTLRGGLGTLVNALSDELVKCTEKKQTETSPVNVKYGMEVTSVLPDAIKGTIKVVAFSKCKNNNPVNHTAEYDHVVFAAPPSREAASVVGGPDIALVNVAYNPSTIQKGVSNAFGLLASERRGLLTDPDLLGIVFDSSIMPTAEAAHGWKKYTVMLKMVKNSTVGAGELCCRAKRSIEEHVGITQGSQPEYIAAYIQNAALPAYNVGWHKIASPQALLPGAAHAEALLAGAYSFVGTWVSGGGVGVADCIRDAYDAVQKLK